MDSSPCSVNRDQTTIRTRHYKRDPDEHLCNCPNSRLNHNNCNDQCYIKNINNNNMEYISWSCKRSPKYCPIFGLHYTRLCVLVLVACISLTQSAPTTHHHQVRHRREDKEADWSRPCVPPNMSQKDTNYTTEQMKRIFDIIASECITALQNARNHAPKYASIRWKSKNNDTLIEDVHQTWRNEDGAWLHPERNKQFSYNEKIPSDIKNKIVRQLETLNKKDSEKLLIDMYERFMRIADGIQIIIRDHQSNMNIYNDVDYFELTHIYDKLKQDVDVILCEINEGIMLLKLTPDVPERFQIDSLNDKKIVRDWVIYREYMSLLNFISEVYNNNQ